MLHHLKYKISRIKMKNLHVFYIQYYYCTRWWPYIELLEMNLSPFCDRNHLFSKAMPGSTLRCGQSVSTKPFYFTLFYYYFILKNFHFERVSTFANVETCYSFLWWRHVISCQIKGLNFMEAPQKNFICGSNRPHNIWLHYNIVTLFLKNIIAF